MRFSVSHPPLKGPYLRMASMPYWEQVGVKRQLAPSRGESSHWYNLMSTRKNAPISCLMYLMCCGLVVRLLRLQGSSQPAKSAA